MEKDGKGEENLETNFALTYYSVTPGAGRVSGQ